MNLSAKQQPPRRLAFFVPSLRGGGAERVMLALAEGFSKAGHPVDLVLARAVGPLLEQVPATLRIIDLKRDRVLAALPNLVSYLRREKPAALLAAMGHTNVIALLARLFSRAPSKVVLSVHNTMHYGSTFDLPLKHRILYRFMRGCYPLADGIVAVSRGVAEELVQALGLAQESIRVIYNPIVTPELFALAAQPVDHPWFVEGGPPVIIAAGRLTRQKDYPTLLQAFARVAVQRPARLLILGEGEERASLEALVRQLKLDKCVALPGFESNPYRYMARAALFVSSSAWEGFGNVLVEAMAMGSPVVATDCRFGPSEILEAGKYGSLVPVGAPDLLAEAMLSVLGGHCPPQAVLRNRAAHFTLARALDAYAPLLLQARGGTVS
jgi:glycosyltransferase involved in cell wall biosynthesis